MKWNTTNYKGEPVTWYSGDVIERILQICKEEGLIAHKNIYGTLIAHTANPAAAKILRIIEGEDKDAR